MLRTKVSLFLLVSLIIFSCSDNDDTIPTIQNELTDLDEIKAILSNAITDNILISETGEQLFNGLSYTIVHFESDDSIFFKNSFISSLTKEPAKWNLRFDFTDETFLNSAFLGDSLYVDLLT